MTNALTRTLVMFLLTCILPNNIYNIASIIFAKAPFGVSMFSAIRTIFPSTTYTSYSFKLPSASFVQMVASLIKIAPNLFLYFLIMFSLVSGFP